MAISTCTLDGMPSIRYVLLKEVDETGFVFFSNYESRKGQELAANPNISACFYWPLCHRQVRIEGRAERIAPGASDAYFKSRPIDSQISGMVSPQSQVLNSKDDLLKKIDEAKEKVKVEGEQSVQRPDSWGGYRIVPKYFEFWQGQQSRFHDRFVYEKEGNGWNVSMLAP